MGIIPMTAKYEGKMNHVHRWVSVGSTGTLWDREEIYKCSDPNCDAEKRIKE
jgi:hypothetical protein